MPYRRLPNTDQARLRALDRAYHVFVMEGSSKIPYSEETLQNLQVFLPKFQHALINLDAARNNQIKKNKEFTECSRKARMYISHYIQVMNMAISRNELKPSIRSFYELEDFENAVPPLTSDKDLLKWGKTIIDGDLQRIRNGGNPFYNPSIAVVKVHYERFAESYIYQKNLQNITDRYSSQVNQLRDDADRLILQLWNEIEETFNFGSEQEKRENASKYGVVYVFRKHEAEYAVSKQYQTELSY
jgi:hypothetical protein